MATTAIPYDTVGEMLQSLGNINPRRVRMRPLPGQATERDVLRLLNRENRLFELIDGILVEKIMGMKESMLASYLARVMGNYADEKDYGAVSGADGPLKLMHKLVRLPDIAFFSWSKLPNREYPSEPIPDLVPDLAVEVLSEGNTLEEIERKLKEYFLSGTKIVWIVDPATRTVRVHSAPDRFETLTNGQTLTGGDVLPGFSLPLKQIFARLPKSKGRRSRNGKAKPKKRK